MTDPSSPDSRAPGPRTLADFRRFADDLSLMEGGVSARVLGLAARRLQPGQLPRVLAILLVAACFLPLLWFTARDGTLFPDTDAGIPLLGDWVVIFRFLLALPLLVLAAINADAMLRKAVRQLSRSGVIPRRSWAAFAQAIARSRGARDSVLAEFACLALALAPAIVGMSMSDAMYQVYLEKGSGWQIANGEITTAGMWAEWVSSSIFRFVLYLWLWRFLIWAWLIWRISGMRLQIRPAHPDQLGGLALFGHAQIRFGFVTMACGFVVSGYCINLLLYSGATLFSLRYLVAGYVIGSILILVAPLLPMWIPMARAKRHGLSKYGLLGHRLTRDFDARWRPGSTVTMLDSPSPSAVADFGSGAFANVSAMRLLPVSRRHLWSMALAATAPFLPMFFFAMSLDDLASYLFSIIL